MADEADQANDLIEAQMAALFRTKRYSALQPVGACHYCGERVRAQNLFCDMDCRDDYDREAAIRRKQGV